MNIELTSDARATRLFIVGSFTILEEDWMKLKNKDEKLQIDKLMQSENHKKLGLFP